MKKLFILAIAAVGLLACNGKNEPESSDNSKNPSEQSSGLLSGKFSVSASKQVQFSQGNLQYNKFKQKWCFAEKQYDIIGSNNTYISSSYVSDLIDLFGWGTGNNPTLSSDDNNDYTTFVDWGTNAISNGGNQANLWRTLTRDEWVYMFYTRANAASLFGLGSVNGVNGTIILPDNWSTPQGASFTPSTSKGLIDLGGWYEDSNCDWNDYSNDGHFADNTYSVEQWSKMESAGAVFLPAAGYRSGTYVGSVGWRCFYWSSTLYDDERYAFILHITMCYLSPQDGAWRFEGQSVRLVKDVQ